MWARQDGLSTAPYICICPPAQMRQAMVKLYTTQMACSVIDNAIQIHGGVGYSKMLPLERMYRDARLYRIAEGPDEMMKHIIARYMLEME